MHGLLVYRFLLIYTIKMNKTKLFPKPFPFAIIAIVIFLDQLSKYWVLNKLELNSIGSIDVSKFFDLTMVWNFGVSFGIFRANSEIGRWALVIFTSIFSLVFLIWLWRANNKLSQISLSMIIGGAIGNFIDRIRFGAVVDFLDFSGLYFPWVFNIADSAVVGGALLLALELFLNPDESQAPKSQTKENLPNNNVESK